MHCVLCEKFILSDTADLDEMFRLMGIGELELRKVECSFDTVIGYTTDKQTGKMIEKIGRRKQEYPVCGDCIRKEKADLIGEYNLRDHADWSVTSPMPKRYLHFGRSKSIPALEKAQGIISLVNKYQ
jgi:hypothetical protein